MDDKFNIKVLSCTSNPQSLVWLAMHQDYSTHQVTLKEQKEEFDAGQCIVKHLLAGGRGHYGCFEHPSITLSCGYFNHGTMQQLRTHRVGVSFDVQSFRYTSARLLAVANMELDIEEVIYFRPVGDYTDRSGKQYCYAERNRDDDKYYAGILIRHYRNKLAYGISEEHARGMLPFDFRQHFVLTVNARSLMHLLDLRSKKDAQLECQWFCELLLQTFADWMPDVSQWYVTNRLGKAKLSP